MPMRCSTCGGTAGFEAAEACLVNFYAAVARMGLHVDSDEQESARLSSPFRSGASCLFRHGGTPQRPTKSIRLQIRRRRRHRRTVAALLSRRRPPLSGTSTLIANDARINLTMRRVSPADIA